MFVQILITVYKLFIYCFKNHSVIQCVPPIFPKRQLSFLLWTFAVNKLCINVHVLVLGKKIFNIISNTLTANIFSDCLFVWGFSSNSRIFHSYGDVTFTGKGLQILTYARHLWLFSKQGSLACHIYCDTGHPFIMVISEDP